MQPIEVSHSLPPSTSVVVIVRAFDRSVTVYHGGHSNPDDSVTAAVVARAADLVHEEYSYRSGSGMDDLLSAKVNVRGAVEHAAIVFGSGYFVVLVPKYQSDEASTGLILEAAVVMSEPVEIA